MVNDILKEAAVRGTGRKIQQLGRKDLLEKQVPQTTQKALGLQVLIKIY